MRSPNFTDSGGQHATRYASQHFHHQTHPTVPTATQGRSQQTTYQPRFKPRGPDKPRNDRCNFCGLDGHLERECDLRSILDRRKDYEHKLLKRRNCTLNGQVHHLEEPDLFKQEQDPDSFETADQVINACLVELNLVETPQQTSSWYLDSGATHHVSGDPSVFSSLHQTSGSQVRSAGGQNHTVTGVGNVDVRFLSEKKKHFFHFVYPWNY